MRRGDEEGRMRREDKKGGMRDENTKEMFLLSFY